MIAYMSSIPVKNSEMQPFRGAAADLGGTVLSGDVHIALRIDLQQGPVMAGIFEATRGKVRIDYPFTEHATILEGEVVLTDESGQERTYRPGDSYFIRQGEIIIWDVRVDRVRKAFLNIREG